MKFALGPVTGLVLACLALTACDKKAPDEQAKAEDAVVATVNGQKIRQSDVTELYDALPGQYRQLPIDFLQDQLVERLVDQKLVTAKARADGTEKDAKYKERLSQAKDQILEDVWLSKEIDKRLSPERLKKAYDEMVAEFKPSTEFKASHILVKTEEEGRQVIADLAKGADFAALARDKSLDKGSAAEGGDLGDYFAPDKMVPEFAQAVTALKPGEVSKTPVKSQYGWHVIKVVDTRQSTPPKLEDVEAQIRESEHDKVVQEILEELRSKAKIEKPTPTADAGSGHEGEDAPPPAEPEAK
ncbi:peptidylprolyl isomerase [Emcibacter sp. SYSU 3D8]|uniref:peptidylprolyl isomerase n=1 Tax=Emcibacter sp. SYSU 3D8 TaxID=3133969 RepID=UPI0031FEEF73